MSRDKKAETQGDGMTREVLAEKIYRAGYVVRTERVTMEGCDPVEMKSAYTPDGHYIGSPRDAWYLVARRGIRPQLRTPTSNVCSIGYNAKERKWYGWSHRAIAGFSVGAVVREGQCHAETIPVGTKAKTLLDAKRFAEAFAESVS